VWWEGAFNEQELSILQRKAKESSETAVVGGGSGGGATNTDIRRSKLHWLLRNQETNWVFQKLAFIAASLNCEHYNFDLTSLGEALQLANYDHAETGMYGWHQDYNLEGTSRKLSLVLQLSDPSEYEGGNLQIRTDRELTVKKQRGLVVAFPAYTVHQVTSVTKGNRQSLVAWVAGPQFK
jgi:PKHD-type hydroxylase